MIAPGPLGGHDHPTDHGHPVRIGVRVPARSDAPDAFVAIAGLADRLGLDLITVADAEAPDRLDAWTAVSLAAGVTERLVVAVDGLDLSRRPVAVLARSAATLDLLSAGRAELIIDGGARPDLAEEAIEVIRGLWRAGEPPLRYAGDLVQLPGADRGPAPAHDVPIWIAGDAAFAVAATHADGWVADVSDGAHAVLALDHAVRAAGREPAEVRRLTHLEPAPPERIAEVITSLGISTVVVEAPDADAVRLVAERLAPAVRSRVAAVRAARGTMITNLRRAEVRAHRRPGIRYDELPAALAAAAVEPGDPHYPGVRNGYLRGGSPGLVLRPGDPAEVAEALRFARRHDLWNPLPLSIRSGGHGISGRSTNHGGIVIDLARLNGIELLDPGSGLVRVGPGARWGDVAQALAPHGLAISSGDFGGVGVGGLATAGGIGYLGRQHGLTIDRMRAVELVLPDGSAVRASATEHPELFWGVRGAGAALGVATSFEFEAARVGEVGFAQLVFDATDLAGLLVRYGEAMEQAPRDVTLFLIYSRSPQGPVGHLIGVVDSPSPDTIIDRLQPFARIAPLIGQQIVLTGYPGALLTPPPGPQHGQGEPVSRSAFVDHLGEEAAVDLARFATGGAAYWFQLRAVGGAVADVAPSATAYAHRSAAFSVVAMGRRHAELDPAWDALGRHFHGLYWSFETDRRPERLHDAFPPPTLTRLRALKRRTDPDNVLRDNLDLCADPAAADESAA